jgi:NAD(P)-dependent dehydrogenase (short-subunit alcohol dehydrogenase family)
MLTIDLTGKRALVTGGNSGIGAAIATCLADAGADVAINYLVHPEAAEQLAGQIRDKSRRAMTLQADVSQPSAVQGMFQALEANWGGIDILVNNAGVDGRHALGWEVDVDAWRKVIEINLFGAFYCAREALHRMVPQRSGVIVNMSSVHEQIPWSGYSAYTASKAGVSMLTKTLAQEAAPHGVRVVAIAPGAIQTAINHSVWSNAEGLADLERKIPMGRMGKPEEIAGMVAMIASGAGSYLTGTTVFVDGGMMDFADFAHGG